MKPYIIGLTGGIGSGKSLTALQFNKLGAKVIDADKIVHQLYEDCVPCINEIAEVFGLSVVDSGGHINRAVLAKEAFRSEETIFKLNSVVHPYVLNRMREKKNNLSGLVVWDVPLLIESHMDDLTDTVVVVIADKEMRIERLKARSGMTRDEICDRMNSQTEDYVRLKRADYLCVNNGSESELYAQVRRIYMKLQENIGVEK